jgi:hypothetical protein
MSQKPKPQPWTEEEKQSLRELVRYGAWIMGAIAVTLITVAVLASVFNFEAGAGTTTSSSTADIPAATEVTR